MDPGLADEAAAAMLGGDGERGAKADAGPDRRKVLVLYTGGTMGMKQSPAGLTPVPGYLTEQIQTLPELAQPTMHQVTVVEFDPLLDSTDFEPSDWAKIARGIGDNYFEYDGFVVVMGTDTMAFAASALSFMLENLSKPVIFTGSQIPFCEPYNDARRNLIVSLLLAGNLEFPEVCLFFNDRLLRGNRAKKLSSYELGAFDSPNFPPLALVGVHMAPRWDLALLPPRGRFQVSAALDTSIICVRMVPGFSDDALRAVVASAGLKGLVLEVYGAGNLPSRRAALIDLLRQAQDKGIVVVAVTQCTKGAVVLAQYAVGEALRGVGVVSAGDMTLEAAATKLGYLLSKSDDPQVVAALMAKPLRGERSANEKYAGEPVRPIVASSVQPGFLSPRRSLGEVVSSVEMTLAPRGSLTPGPAMSRL